jgi:hypothetical protein
MFQPPTSAVHSCTSTKKCPVVVELVVPPAPLPCCTPDTPSIYSSLQIVGRQLVSLQATRLTYLMLHSKHFRLDAPFQCTCGTWLPDLSSHRPSHSLRCTRHADADSHPELLSISCARSGSGAITLKIAIVMLTLVAFSKPVLPP